MVHKETKYGCAMLCSNPKLFHSSAGCSFTKYSTYRISLDFLNEPAILENGSKVLHFIFKYS